jgi:hypothetical protein
VASAGMSQVSRTVHHSERFRPYPHVVWVRQADATVLLDAERGRYYTLNEVAGRIWELMAAGEPVLEVLTSLQDEFNAPATALEGDVAGLLEQLLVAGLIERVPA